MGPRVEEIGDMEEGNVILMVHWEKGRHLFHRP
jgi:hypothetical protein